MKENDKECFKVITVTGKQLLAHPCIKDVDTDINIKKDDVVMISANGVISIKDDVHCAETEVEMQKIETMMYDFIEKGVRYCNIPKELIEESTTEEDLKILEKYKTFFVVLKERQLRYGIRKSTISDCFLVSKIEINNIIEEMFKVQILKQYGTSSYALTEKGLKYLDMKIKRSTKEQTEVELQQNKKEHKKLGIKESFAESIRELPLIDNEISNSTPHKSTSRSTSTLQLSTEAQQWQDIYNNDKKFQKYCTKNGIKKKDIDWEDKNAFVGSNGKYSYLLLQYNKEKK